MSASPLDSQLPKERHRERWAEDIRLSFLRGTEVLGGKTRPVESGSAAAERKGAAPYE